MQSEIPRIQTDQSQLDEDNDINISTILSDWNDPVQRRYIFKAKDDVNASMQTHASRTAINKRTEICLLEAGDHIAWHQIKGIWHHAIVVGVCTTTRMLRIINFRKIDGSFKIVEETVDAAAQAGELFRFDYETEITDNNSTDVVLTRARALLGEGGYRLLGKNCEHFATYCKTGIADSAQVHWARGKIKEILLDALAYASTKLLGAVFTEIEKQAVKEAIGKIAIAEAVERFFKASDNVGAGMVVLFEAAHFLYDFYKISKEAWAGNIELLDFVETVVMRFIEGVLATLSSVGCSLYGQYLGAAAGALVGSCIPVVGTAVGAYVGSFIGSVAGGAIGSFVGKLSENYPLVHLDRQEEMPRLMFEITTFELKVQRSTVAPSMPVF